MIRKKIIITGASSGIGMSLAKEFYNRGYDLGIMARREAILENFSKELTGKGNVFYQTIDLNDDSTIVNNINSLISKMGGLDIFVANAGMNGITPVGKDKYPEIKEIITTNLISTILSIDTCVKYFRTQKKGQVVGISSFSAFKAIPGNGAYSGSKAGLSNYLDAIYMELMNKNIKVTTVHPGFIKTALSKNLEKYPFSIDSDLAAKKIANGIEKQKKDITVPTFPWAFLRYIIPYLPGSLVKKFF